MYKWILTACACLSFGPAFSETLDAYLETRGSHAMLQIDLPFDVVQEVIAAELKDEYSGSKPDPTNALVDDTLTWSARITAFELGKEGDCLMAKFDAKGGARVRGKIRAIVKIPISSSADLEAKASFQLCLKLQSDWSIEPGLSGKVSLTEADVYGISIRGILQDDLDREVRERLERVAAELRELLSLREEAGKLWADICQLRDDGNRFAVIPRAVAATQFVMLTDALRISFVVSGDVVAAQDPPEPCPALPSSLILLQ